MSFYRIYRPQVIDEIDNIAIRDSLLTLLSKPKKDLPHAFFMSGPRGAGKTTAARVIAKLFNCEKLTKVGPCGKCQQCVTIAEGRNLDVLELDAASNRGIDEIRALRDGIQLSPALGTHKIYIIDEVHMLTAEAFNALLKTLEEPPGHAVFVLATTDPQKVPVTITSRCISYVFAKASGEELLSALSRIVKQEKIDIEDEALSVICASVDGSFRDAVKYLEQASLKKGTITREIVETLFAITASKSVSEFLTHLVNRQVSQSLAIIGGLSQQGTDFKAFIVQCLSQLQSALVAAVAGSPADPAWNKDDLGILIRKLSQAYGEMRISPIAQLPLELAVVEYCRQETPSALTPREKTPVTESAKKPSHAPHESHADAAAAATNQEPSPAPVASGLLTLEKLTDCWPDVIAELKPHNHSVAGVMRSTRPKAVSGGIVTIEAFYTFHKDKLSETKTRETLGTVFKKLFGEKVKVEVVLGKK